MKTSEDIRSLQLTLGVYLFIFAARLVVYFLSGVVALYAEALHTLSDIFIAAHEVEARLHADLPGGICVIHVDPASEVGGKPRECLNVVKSDRVGDQGACPARKAILIYNTVSSGSFIEPFRRRDRIR